jgi:conjugal transfer pilus assembly protein TraE
MKLSTYLKSWDGALKENRFHRIAFMVAIVVILVQSLALWRKDSTIILIPPQMEERGQVSGSAASQEMQVSWGRYIATLLGNVTPQSVEVLAANVGQHLSPRMYQAVLTQLQEQAKTIQEEQITVSFVPTLARWEASLPGVVVSGEMITRGIRGGEKRMQRTYELKFIVQNYRVLLDDLRAYEGTWQSIPRQEPTT